MANRNVKKTGVVLAAASLVGAVALSSAAIAETRQAPRDNAKAAAPRPAAAMTTAMSRDLGLTASQVRARLTTERRASQAEKKLRRSLGASFGGAWLAGSSATPRLVVGVTSAARSGEVRAAGAQPKTVAHSERQLNVLKEKLDRRARKAPRTVTGWYVDAETNSVVVRSLASGSKAASTFMTASGLSESTVRVERAKQRPRLLADLRGGDPYLINGSARCSVGFAVQGGFVSAGHCGKQGDTTTGPNQEPQGTFGGSSFPGDDYSWIDVSGDWTPKGSVLGDGGAEIPVAGSNEAAEGASVCRSGSTTGWHCGIIRTKNQTVTYPQGTVEGLTQTDVCAEPGDSGGSFISGDQAQGVTSGGSGNCSAGGETFFQPVNEILQVSGRTLVTG